ncbi:UNVERIFIED_ORG: hypothetical protein ABRZ91_003300 [Heyndrickxia coagulans]
MNDITSASKIKYVFHLKKRTNFSGLFSSYSVKKG